MTTAIASSRNLHDVRAYSGTSVRASSLGMNLARYGLALTVFWIGAMKFSAYEAGAIHGLVANSPFMGWLYALLSVQGASAVIGTAEIAVAALIALYPWSPRLSAIGSGLAAGMFLTTLSFLFSTPGVTEASLGFPALSVVPGQFLLKDLVLLGAAVWLTGEAWQDARDGG